MWVWKTGLTVTPVGLALWLYLRLNYGVHFETLTVGTLAATGAVAASLALWKEHTRTVERRGAAEAHSKFLAAAEANLDAFSIFESVRDESGEIVDFRFLYVNGNAERMIGASRSELLGKTLCSEGLINKDGSVLKRYCRVVDTGKPLNEELQVVRSNIKAAWIRYQVVKLGDGVAITCSDISEAKATQARYENLAEFTDSVFQNAPFSIIATDTHGLITAMNVAAEKLSGYSREELVGKASADGSA